MRFTSLAGLMCLAFPAWGAESGCAVERTAWVAFQSAQARDQLLVRVEGDPCHQAQLTIAIKADDGRELYLYEGELLDHLPFVVYEPDLQPLVTYFAEKIIRDGFIRTTRDLPPWEPVEIYYEHTNDIIIIPEQDYVRLRANPQPIFWHAAGDATWVHVIYNPVAAYGQIILRGGVFQSGAKSDD